MSDMDPEQQQAGEPAEQGEEESQQIQTRRSLLDVLVEKYQENAPARTSRLLVTAEIDKERLKTTDASEEVAKFHNFLSKLNDGSVTGWCVLMDKDVLVHCLEAPTPTLLSVLRKMSENNPENLFRNARVCSLTEEIPRVYPVWAYRSIFMQADTFEQPNDWLPVIFETLQNLVDLGRELQEMTAEEAITYLTEGQSKQLLARLPSSDRVRAHAKVEELCTVDEYLEIFDKPIHFTLEGELIWPNEPFLQY